VRRFSPGRLAGGLRSRLRGARYLIADVGFAIGGAIRSAIGFLGRGFRAIGRALAAFWDDLSIEARRRLVAAIGVAAVVLLFLGLAVPILPCELPGGDRCPPDDAAAEIVPATSLAYFHVNLDPDTEQYEDLAAIAARLPLISRQVTERALATAPGFEGSTAEFRRLVEPWFGGEAAVALIRGSGPGAQEVVLLESADSAGARRYARRLAAGAIEEEPYRETRIATDERGLATAEVDDFLAIGSRSGVRAIVDTAAGVLGATALADDDDAEDVRAELPDHRFADAWVRADGVDLLAANPVFGSLAPFVSPGASRGAAISLSAGDDGLELAVRSELDPKLERSSPGFFATFPTFEPELPERLSGDALAYLGIGEPGETVRALLRQAADEAPGIATGFERLVDRLREEGEVDVGKELLPALGDEGAFAIEPERDSEALGPGPIPYLEFVGRGVDEQRAARALADLQRPLAEAADTGLQAPVFGEREVAGVEARSVRVSPTVEVTFGVFDDLAVVATSPAAIQQLADGDGGLDSDDAFERATEDFEDEVSMLAFFDLRELIEEGFQIGLAEVPAFATFSEELRRLEAFGLEVHADDELLSTDARLLVSD
jgi:hypothetical protein